MIDYEVFALGDLALEGGGTLRDAKLAYKTYGRLGAARTNAVVFPTAYGGTHVDNEWLIGPGKPLDPARYFIVSVNLFGGGLSSSPSTAAGAQAGAGFPHVTIYDNVAAQHRLVVERLGANGIALALGFSMGAQQTFHWAAYAPELVARIAPFCGSARTAQHNLVFLDGIEATLRADPSRATTGRVWAAWGLSQAFFRGEHWRSLGYASRDAFVREAYVASFEAGDTNDLLAMLWTWQHADVGSLARYGGSTEAALRAMTARAIVMPCATDLYFPPEDSALEVEAMPNAELAVIPSVYGHGAGGDLEPAASAWIAERIARLLAT